MYITCLHEVKNITIDFFSDNGVFSKNHLDYGSRLLIETFLKNESDYENILDLGCGYGLIGISLAKITGKNVTMCDVNKRALHLCERNIKINEVDGKAYESNAYECVKNKYEYTLYDIFHSSSNNDTLLEFNKRYPTNKQLEDKLREIIDEYSKDGEIKIKEIIKNINN